VGGGGGVGRNKEAGLYLISFQLKLQASQHHKYSLPAGQIDGKNK
jgi:hypothetical protein